jgi:benzoyl-CoA 2,3-dioxygenase component B
MIEKKNVATFDDWVDVFRLWQKDIGYDTSLFSSVLQGYEFSEKFSQPEHSEILFGEFAGQPVWEKPSDIPKPEARDLLLKLIMVQGDTEFASVEQQRRLIDTAPTDKDLRSLVRINAEEMRHGWQMSYLLVEHFGDSGKAEAKKLLERSADRGERILGAFNQPLQSWLDFFTFTAFVDRDGMYQLKMQSYSGFAPLARSMGPMLNEESFHLLTGLTGLQRILRAGNVPADVLQRRLNYWLSACYDLFGHERSRGAGSAYHWGLKGRFNEPEAGPVTDPEQVNQAARELYYNEVQNLVQVLNREVADDQAKLYAPDIKFHRAIGEFRGQRYSVHGDALDEQAYNRHLQEVLPTDEDQKKLDEITRDPTWIAA